MQTDANSSAAPSLRAQQPERSQRDWSASNLARSWRRFRANRLAIGALVLITCLCLMALFAPLISRYVTHAGPSDQELVNQFAPPSTDNWFGTDEYGRDVFTRIAYGARASLLVGLLAAVVRVVIGTSVGALAAYYGGWVDTILMRFVDVMLCIPTLFALILMASLMSFGPASLAVVIAAFSWFGLSRLIRSEILSVREREYVEAARVVGASDRRIIIHHILPNTTYLIIYSVTSGIPGFILAETALSYLGLGIQPPTPSWGNMLNNALQYLYESKALIFIPGLFIWLTVLSMTLVGNALRDALDTRLAE